MKIKKLVLCLVVLLAFTACGGKNPAPSTSETKKNDKEQHLNLGEEWVVDGKWKLTVNSVKVLKGRNEFSEKKPEQVVCIDYTYENIGVSEDTEGLFMMPESVVDEKGEMGYSYPAVEELNYPQATPVGAKMKNAQEAFGLNNNSKKVKINFNNFVEIDGKYETFKAMIEADVEE